MPAAASKRTPRARVCQRIDVDATTGSGRAECVDSTGPISLHNVCYRRLVIGAACRGLERAWRLLVALLVDGAVDVAATAERTDGGLGERLIEWHHLAVAMRDLPQREADAKDRSAATRLTLHAPSALWHHLSPVDPSTARAEPVEHTVELRSWLKRKGFGLIRTLTRFVFCYLGRCSKSGHESMVARLQHAVGDLELVVGGDEGVDESEVHVDAVGDGREHHSVEGDLSAAGGGHE